MTDSAGGREADVATGLSLAQAAWNAVMGMADELLPVARCAALQGGMVMPDPGGREAEIEAVAKCLFHWDYPNMDDRDIGTGYAERARLILAALDAVRGTGSAARNQEVDRLWAALEAAQAEVEKYEALLAAEHDVVQRIVDYIRSIDRIGNGWDAYDGPADMIEREFLAARSPQSEDQDAGK